MSQNEYTFVQATIDDVPVALELRRKLFDDMGVNSSLLLDNSRLKLQETYLRAYKDEEIVHFFALDDKADIVAVTGAIFKKDFPYRLFKPGYYGWIIDVFTEPEHRGKGLAAKLMALTHDWLKQKGVQEAKLIASGASARRLYERLGYRPTWEMSYNLSDQPTYNELIDANSKQE